MFSSDVILYSFLGGLIPALLWLFFWLREDRCQPEPRAFIFLAFIAGMITVLAVLPFEKLAASTLSGGMVIVAWALIEEVFKFGAAYLTVLRRRAVDEPIDDLIYMISVALGFAAFENTLFLISALQHGDVINSILTGNLRFIGAMLLHTLASATVGIWMALAFYKSRSVRILYTSLGLILAIILHALFNFFIITSNGGKLFLVFALVWIGIIVVLLMFEKIKLKTRDYC